MEIDEQYTDIIVTEFFLKEKLYCGESKCDWSLSIDKQPPNLLTIKYVIFFPLTNFCELWVMGWSSI